MGLDFLYLPRRRRWPRFRGAPAFPGVTVGSGAGNIGGGGAGGFNGAMNPSLMGGASAPATSSLLTGLLAWWTLNETSGNRLDSSGNGNTMVQSGTVSSTSGPGVMGAASVWNGNSANYLSLATTLISSGDWTVAGWFNRSGFSAAAGLWAQGPSGSTGRQSIGCTNTSLLRVRVDGATSTNGTTTLSVDTWYHVALTVSGTAVNLYLNGSSTPEITATKTPSYTGNNITVLLNDSLIGAGGGTSTREVGWGMWNVVLTTTQIANLYAAGSGVQYPFTGVP